MVGYPTGTTLLDRIDGLDTADLINQGGQKAVYKATVYGRTVALKIIRLPTQEEAELDVGSAAERAEREFSIIEQADVPVLTKSGPLGLSIVEIAGVSWMYFTEEWIDGPTLSELIGQGRLSPNQIARLGKDLVEAVCWLFSNGLVHRDIKPRNVMWASDREKYVLLDPGVALDLHGPSLTKVPYAVGTAAYLSPEQTDPYHKRDLDFRSDLFAIGVVLYEAATGSHPFLTLGTTPAQLLTGILNTNPKPVADIVLGFPKGLSDVITRFLGKQPHERYRSCAFALQAIEAAAHSLEIE